MAKITEIFQAVESGKVKGIAALVADALAEGLDPLCVLNDGMISAMGAVGEQFSRNEIFVPEMLAAARTMKKGVEVLKPHLAAGAASGLGTCVIGTVQGDLHDIGKNLVALMIESAGFEVIDLGVDVSAEAFIKALKDTPATILALSCLLTTTMPAMRETAAAVKACGLSGFKIMAGGAPITEAFAQEIGADGYASDAARAAAMAKRFAKEARKK